MRRNSSKTIIVVSALFFFFLATLGCANKESKRNYDAQIRRALDLIESGYFPEAEKIFLDVKSQDPQNCQASYGLVFVSINKFVTSLNSIISLLSGVGGFSAPIELQRIREQSLSKLIHTLLSPFLFPIDEISRNIKIVIDKKCSVDVAVPITIGSDTNPISKFYLGKKGGTARRWGPAEASFIGAIANMLNSFFNLILSINIDIDLAKLIEAQINFGSIGFQTNPQNFLQDQSTESILRGFATQQIRIFSSAIEINPADPVGIFSSLAYIIDTSPDLLKLNPGAEYTIGKTLEQLSYSFKLLSDLIELIPTNDKNNILAYEDVGEKGLSVDDIIYLNVYNYSDLEQGLFTRIRNIDIKIDSILLSLFIKPILDKETRRKYQDILLRFSKAFDVENPNIPDEQRWIYAEDIRYLLPLFEIKNTIRFNPKKFVEGLKSNPEGLRAILPFWTDLNGDGFPDFIIEAETVRNSKKFCFEKQERIEKPFVLGPLIQIQREDVIKRVDFIYSKGKITSDFSCEIRTDLKSNSIQNYSASILASLYAKNFSIDFKNYGLIFLVSPCEQYDTAIEKNFICYDTVGKNAVPKTFIAGKKYNLAEVIKDKDLSSEFEIKVVRSYTEHTGDTPWFHIFVESDTVNVRINWRPEMYQNATSFTIEAYNTEDNSGQPITSAVFSKEVSSGNISIDIKEYREKFGDIPKSLVVKLSYFWEDCSNTVCTKYSTLIKKIPVYIHYPADFGFENSDCTIASWRKLRSTPFSSYLPELNFISDEFHKIECKQKTIEFGNRSFQKSVEVEVDSCLLPFNRIAFILPVSVIQNEFMPEDFEVYALRRELTTDEIKVMSLGINAGYYINENISLSKTNGENTVFYYFFTDPNVLRDETFKKFPKYTKAVIGCQTVISRCFFSQDERHFPSKILFKGQIYKPSIKSDCIFPEGNWSYYYVAWRDPTFFDSVEVNLENLGNLCPQDPIGWIKPDQYIINKVISDFLSKTLSPINTLVLQIIGLVLGGSNIGLASGEFCQ